MHNMDCVTLVCIQYKGENYFFFWWVVVSQVSGLVRNFNIGIYSDTINVINVILCMIERYLFIPLSVILTVFQGRSSVK